jgi:hypothetical protein
MSLGLIVSLRTENEFGVDSKSVIRRIVLWKPYIVSSTSMENGVFQHWSHYNHDEAFVESSMTEWKILYISIVEPTIYHSS